jgi:hypothetical protein
VQIERGSWTGARAVQGRLVEVEPSEDLLIIVAVSAAESKVFRAYDPEQVLLMSPVLAEWVAKRTPEAPW